MFKTVITRLLHSDFTNLDRVVNFDDMLLNANSGAINWYLG